MIEAPAVPQQLADLPYAHLLQPHRGPLSRDARYDPVAWLGRKILGRSKKTAEEAEEASAG